MGSLQPTHQHQFISSLAIKTKNIMPIYLNIFSLIIPKNVIAEKYKGGISQFFRDFRFSEFEFNQEDDEVFSFGDMNFDGLPIDELIEKGLHFDKTNQYTEDFAVICRYGDDFWDVPWIQHNKVFAWHKNASKAAIQKAEEISNLTVDDISEMFDNGQNPFGAIRVEG